MAAGKMQRMAIVLCLTLTVVNAWAADEVSELRKQLQDQYKAITEMQAKLVKLEETQAAQQQKMETMKAGEMTVPETLKWAEKIKLYGDFRYRYQYIGSESNGTDKNSVNRNRIRVRLGLTSKINDELNFDMRIATGKYDDTVSTANGDPTSSNQTLGDSWTYKGIWLDRAYVSWVPASVSDIKLLVGKFGTPFYVAGGNQLIWDSDLNMEGVAAQYNTKFSDNTTLFANVGGFNVRNDKESVDDDINITMWGTQGGVIQQLDKNNKLIGAVGFYKFGNLEGKTTLVKSATAKGNTTSNDRYVYNYDLFEASGEWSTKMGEKPASLYGDYVINTASGVQDNMGWLLGASYNKCKDPGSWALSYDYRDIGKDAVIGAFSDGDFSSGGTNGSGHRFGATYQLGKNAQAGVSYSLDKKANSAGSVEDDVNRLQVDLMVNF